METFLSLTENHVLIDLHAITKEEAYREILWHAVSKGFIKAGEVEVVFSGLLERDAMISTGLGDGLAVPHTSVAGLEGVLVLVAKTTHPIDCQSLDGKPVFLFIMILVPKDHAELHLKTLALVARKLTRPGVRESLASADQASQIAKLLKDS